MGNIMTSIYTGVSGIQVNQAALNTTSHNLANVNTKGYVRQQVVASDFLYQSIGTSGLSSLQVGLGTDMDAIRQIRETFLDKSYRLEVGRQGFYEVQQEAVSEIEDLFGELEGEAFHETISDFWTNLQELVKEPDNRVKRSAFVETAVTFLERAENISNQLNSYQVNLNTQISEKVNRINEIGKQISQLNSDIVKYESSGQNANDLRDSRNTLMDELGELVKFTYREDSIGSVTINAEGYPFVTEDSYNKMATQKISGSSMLEVVWDGMDGYPVFDFSIECNSELNTNIGSLKGLLIARGNEQANYKDIPKPEDYATEVLYNQAVEDYNNTVDPSIVMTVQAEFDQLIHGVVTAINDVLAPNNTINQVMDNIGIDTAAATNVILTIDGVSQSINLTNDTSGVLLWDQGIAPTTKEEKEEPGEVLFKRTNTERYKEAEISYIDGSGNTQTQKVYVYQQEYKSDPYSLYSLGAMEVNSNVLQDVANLPLSGTSESGLTDAYDMNTCEKLADLFENDFSTLSPNELTSYTFQDYYTALIGNIGNRGNALATMTENQTGMVESLDSQRQTVMGVSSEEELTNMIKFQYAYSASSKYISVINDMLEQIINRM
ncbi:flagellar hook-associated protein FlgK [Anaeromicropila populeti]|uniref:Flagellar hook-associated protein 1 n=1 Tax=Anaeromicropila populeti TaxID=37658 RepID=A0A1I6HXQ7_9FIRM|nr:flagellar hook-associated protein FlgK [Anaeromicropila populeti]SFR59010.1 flagellar hook-associated protein 1 FlgK [Anaeromicropila populeti]